MNSTLYLKFKEWLTSTYGLHVYRRGTPLGLDLLNDLQVLVPNFTPSTVLDVGANIGQTALRFHKLWPSAYLFCFEPVKDTYRQLENNTSQIRSLKTYNFGLSDRTGEAPIFLSGNSALSTLERPAFSVRSLSGATETVQLETLDGWCEKTKIGEIDLLKIDAEGHDLQVLEGGRQMFATRKVKAVFIEAHLSGQDIQLFLQISQWLEEQDFQLVGFYDQELSLRQGSLYGNLLYFDRKHLKSE